MGSVAVDNTCHIFRNVVTNRLQVLLGAISRHDTSTLTQRILVENFTMHQEYDTLTTVNDIALIKVRMALLDRSAKVLDLRILL